MTLQSAPDSIVLRHVTDADADDLLRWRNMPHVRASMINQDEIDPESHKAWWARVQQDDGKRFLIAERNGAPLAVINFFDIDPQAGSAWWGFYLTDIAEESGEGLGMWIDVESLALRFAFEVLELDSLLCETRATNDPVLMLHDRFGFDTLPPEDFPNAVAHDLIVKQYTRQTFDNQRTKTLSQTAIAAAMPGAGTREENQPPLPGLVIVGSANWDEVVADLAEVQQAHTRQLLDCYAPPFGQGMMDLLNPEGDLRKADPDYIVMAERFEDFMLPLETRAESMIEGIQARFSDYLGHIRDIRAGVSGHIFVHDIRPVRPALTTFHDATAGRGALEQIVQEMNKSLAELCDTLPDCTLLPISRLIDDLGADAADPGKYWLMGRFPFGPKFTPAYQQLLTGALMALNGQTARALVLDLDNTMWGGVVGDDGTFGLDLGTDYPGNQFVAFQNFVKSIAARGIILTVCSKNTEEVALAAFRDNPNMVISEDDLITHRINWMPKSQNIHEISQEIDLGLGSLMFIDDNPMERGEVRQNCPGVIVPEMPHDVAEWPRFLAAHPALCADRLVDQDRDRAKKYKIRAQIQQAEKSSADRHSFLRNLGMGIEMANVTDATKPRALQLFAKTNQFNTTTKRYSETDADTILADGGDLMTVRITDKFGSDEVIAVVVITYREDQSAWIDNWVMSCRVLGRGVETAILAEICKRAQARGCTTVTGQVIETERNHPCRDVYARHDFTARDDTHFVLDLETPVAFPDWFEYL